MSLLFSLLFAVATQERINNGLTVVIEEDRQAPAVTARLSILGAGELYTADSLSGQASFTARILAKGTRARSAQEIAEQLNRAGATLESAAPFGGDATTITLTAPPETFEQALFLTADVLVNPVFPQEELDSLRGQELATLAQRANEPLTLLNACFLQAIYGAHPAALESATPATLQALTRDHLVKWHRERYAPQNATLTITGPINPRDILNKVKRLNFVWTRMAFTPTLPDLPPPAPERRIHLVDLPGAAQTLFRVGNRSALSGRITANWSVTRTVPVDSSSAALRELLREIELSAQHPNLDSLQIAVVGDAAKIRDALAAFGPVTEQAQKP